MLINAFDPTVRIRFPASHDSKQFFTHCGSHFPLLTGGSSTVRSLYRRRLTCDTVAAVPVPKHSRRSPFSWLLKTSSMEMRTSFIRYPISRSRVITLSRVNARQERPTQRHEFAKAFQKHGLRQGWHCQSRRRALKSPGVFIGTKQ